MEQALNFKMSSVCPQYDVEGEHQEENCIPHGPSAYQALC